MNRFAAPSVNSGQFAMPPLPTMPQQQDQSSNIFNADPTPLDNAQSPEKQMIESGSADDSSFLLTPQSKSLQSCKDPFPESRLKGNDQNREEEKTMNKDSGELQIMADSGQNVQESPPPKDIVNLDFID